MTNKKNRDFDIPDRSKGPWKKKTQTEVWHKNKVPDHSNSKRCCMVVASGLPNPTKLWHSIRHHRL